MGVCYTAEGVCGLGSACAWLRTGGIGAGKRAPAHRSSPFWGEVVGRIFLKGLGNGEKKNILRVNEQKSEENRSEPKYGCVRKGGRERKSEKMCVTGTYLLNGCVFCCMVSEVRQVVALALMLWSEGYPRHRSAVTCLFQGAWLEQALGCGLIDTPLFPLTAVKTEFLHQ